MSESKKSEVTKDVPEKELKNVSGGRENTTYTGVCPKCHLRGYSALNSRCLICGYEGPQHP